jgi:GT2 family glycosyltransferase
MALRKAAYVELGGLDLDFEFLDLDNDLSMRARSAGWEVLHSPSLAAFHVGSGSPQTAGERVLRFYRNRWRLLRKFGKIRHPGLVRALVLGRLGAELLALNLMGSLLVPSPDREEKLAGRRALVECVRRFCR